MIFTIVVVYIIRRLSIDRSWTLASVIGGIIGAVILMVGSVGYETNLSNAGIILGTIISILLSLVIEFFMHNVDYSRTEYVQFEDDEYYYYVKAIPKNSVKKETKKVKKITSVSGRMFLRCSFSLLSCIRSLFGSGIPEPGVC